MTAVAPRERSRSVRVLVREIQLSAAGRGQPITPCAEQVSAIVERVEGLVAFPRRVGLVEARRTGAGLGVAREWPSPIGSAECGWVTAGSTAAVHAERAGEAPSDYGRHRDISSTADDDVRVDEFEAGWQGRGLLFSPARHAADREARFDDRNAPHALYLKQL